jgi:hypothetical protein
MSPGGGRQDPACRQDRRPALVIGEVKSRLSSIDANDLKSLQKIQQHVRRQGVECFILAAVMRELHDEEASALRDLAQHPPNTLLTGSAFNPVLRSCSPSATCPQNFLGKEPTIPFNGRQPTASSAWQESPAGPTLA